MWFPPVRPSPVRRAAAAVLCAAAAFSSAPHADAGGFTQQGVRGKLTASDTSDDAEGRFRIRLRDRRNGVASERVEVDAVRLDATREDDGDLPTYRVWVVAAGETTSADLGAMRLSPRGRAVLRFDTRRTSLPEGVTTLEDFGGGTLQVRLGDTVVLSGAIPEFLGPDDGNGEGSGAAAVLRASSRLRPADAADPWRGFVDARWSSTPRGTRESLRVRAVLLERSGAPYTVVCIDTESAETELGTFTPRGRFGEGRLVIDTRDGAAIPGGDVKALGGQAVEVRAADGTVVLEGTFPSVE